ncbi:hypothetical protein WN943_027088 [Citrus x changshan-huyou]
MFVDAFYEKYFPRSVAEKMEREFLNLIQGSKSVATYEDTFNTLSRFAPTLVNTKEKRCRRFLEGLNSSIKDPLKPLRITNYVDLVYRALYREMHVNGSQKRQQQWKKHGQQRGSQGKNSNNN